MRRNPSNTTAETGAMMRAEPPSPPAHVNVPDDAMAHWRAVVNAKSPDAWTGHDLTLAAELARTFADLECHRREVMAEGDFIDGKVNPRHALAGDLTARAIRLTRLLQIHPLATQGRSADQAARNTTARDARETAAALDDESLIPTGKKGAH